jgi:hypothetical protein
MSHTSIQPSQCDTNYTPRQACWSSIWFGKYEGLSLPQLALRDPDYLYWAVQSNVFNTDNLKRQATLVCQRARRIRLPATIAHTHKVFYAVAIGSGKLREVCVVGADRLPDDFIGYWCTADYFDLSAARQICPYDKTGSKIIVSAVKEHIFKGGRLTKDRCEEFFADPANFALS